MSPPTTPPRPVALPTAKTAAEGTALAKPRKARALAKGSSAPAAPVAAAPTSWLLWAAAGTFAGAFACRLAALGRPRSGVASELGSLLGLCTSSLLLLELRGQLRSSVAPKAR